MNCKRAHELISYHLDEQLDPAGQSRLNKHLAACDECATYLSDLKEGLNALHELPLEEPSENFDWNLRRKLQQAQREPWRYQDSPMRSGFWPRFTIAAAAALILTLGGGYAAYRILQSPASSPLQLLNSGPEHTADSALDIPTLPQPYPGVDGGNGSDLQVVGQGDMNTGGAQQRGTIQRTEHGKSLPPLSLRDSDAASETDTLAAEPDGTAPEATP